MQLHDLNYDLPLERIAQTPIEPRDAARLLVDRGSSTPEHRHVTDLPELLEPDDLVVLNDSRVIPARLRLHRESGAAVEVLLLEPQDEQHRVWEALARPARKLKVGELLLAADDSEVVRVHGRNGDTMTVEVLGPDDALCMLARRGEMPLPPYITTPLADPGRYQTVYAAEPGSVAAPTAGLHLTESVLSALSQRGVAIARVELVVGLDTFRPVTEDDPTRHHIHSERYRVPAATLEACRTARRVVAVGTTAVRALESAATGELAGRTRLFIHRGYQWQLVDALMTNFHLPRTTLLMMIDAFIGPRWRTLYDTAMQEDYRFLSFGDAMLLDRHAA